MDLPSLLVFGLGLLEYVQPPSHSPLAAPSPGLTGFGAGRCHSIGRRPDAHSSGPSGHRWCRWRCRGSQGWASRLEEEVLRGHRPGPPVPPPLIPGIHTPQGSEPRGASRPLSL